MMRIVLAAILAGVVAGLITTAIQRIKVEPLILQAETYEQQGGGEVPAAGLAGQGAAEHAHNGEAWAPADGLERLAYTGLANILTGVAFGLLLTAAVMFTGAAASLLNGAIWGALGFAVFSLAPAFGLPPELPGMPAGELGARQFWWAMTVVLSAGGLALLLLQKRMPLLVLGVALIAVPHVVGAPSQADHHSPVPASLAAEFTAASIVTAGLFWVILGLILGGLLARELGQQKAEA